MSKQKNIETARLHLSPAEFKKYEEWLEMPWVGRYPYLGTLLLMASLLANLILSLELTK